jgi:hypothetical protein
LILPPSNPRDLGADRARSKVARQSEVAVLNSE